MTRYNLTEKDYAVLEVVGNIWLKVFAETGPKVWDVLGGPYDYLTEDQADYFMGHMMRETAFLGINACKHDSDKLWMADMIQEVKAKRDLHTRNA